MKILLNSRDLYDSMTQHPPFQLSVMFASLVGAGGFVLAVQAWNRFRGTPFGNALRVLPVFMLIIAVYHPLLVVFPEHLEVALLAESAAFASLVVFAVLMLRIHWRMGRGGA